ncbi:MAG: sigma-70 family RNA polymerase sigma factor [Myxococcota bacterium]
MKDEALFAEQRARLFGLAYRLTGSAEDAEDAVQEAFVRLLEGGTSLAAGERAFWLVRVTTNLAIDALRRRKRRAYVGPWLPSPVDAAGDIDEAADARYDRLESATFAFLVALEALGPRQRAVLLLRDVVGAPAREVARILALSEANVRVIHTRARRAMETYDRSRCAPTAELQARHRAALEGFLGALLAQDVSALEAWLAESARTVTDSAGNYTALASELEGRARVARFYVQAARNRQTGEPRAEIRILNGLPALVIRLGRPVRRQAPLTVIGLELDGEGRIARVLTVLATRKLAALARS